MSSNAAPPGGFQNPGDVNTFMAAGAGNKDAQAVYKKQQDTFNAQHQGGNKKAAPPPPDYQGLAQQQSDASRQNTQAQTQANRPNINTPFASQQWTQGPDGSWTMSSGLSGGLGQGASALGNQAGAALSNPLDPSLFGPVQTGDQARNQAITGAYDQARSRLDPRFAEQDQQVQSQLAGQGLDPNSQAYRNAMRDYGQTKNDAYNQAMYSAIGQGTQAGATTFGENLAAQQQQISNALRQREAPLQELSQLQGFTATPGFTNAGVAETPQFLPAGIAGGNYNLQNQEMQNQAIGDALGALGSMVGGVGSVAKGFRGL